MVVQLKLSMHLLLSSVRSKDFHFIDFKHLVLGTKYVHGNIGATIYIASGNTADWTYGKANITFSYAVELRDTGKCILSQRFFFRKNSLV